MTETKDWKPSDVEEPLDLPAPPDDPLPFAPAPEPIVFDRSTVERYAKCPFQGWAVEKGLVTDESFPATSGSECHRIVSLMIEAHIDTNAQRGAAVDAARQAIPMARPDVQQDVAANLWPSVFGLARLLTYTVPPGGEVEGGILRNPHDILRWQGGKGDRSGQLARELIPATNTRGATIITSEVDLLLAGETGQELAEIDFKRYKGYTATDIKAAFQFRFHAWLLFGIYPELEQLRVSVWNLPTNQRTTDAVFTRRDIENITGVLLSAVRNRDGMKHEELDIDLHRPATVEVYKEHVGEMAWPHPEKCIVCPAILDCPRAATPALRLNEDPARFAHDTELMDIAVCQRKTHLRAYVDEKGDIPYGDGLAFGLGAAKPDRKPTANSYTFHEMPLETLPPETDLDGEQLMDKLGEAFDGKEATDHDPEH